MNMKCGVSCACSCKNAKDWGLLALRVAMGVIFIAHGYAKLNGGMPMFTGMVAGLGFPMASFFAYAAALTEFLGGIALLLGIGTSIASVLTAIVMLVAILGVKGLKLPMIDADLSLLAMSVAIFCMGPGRFSLAATMCKGCEEGGRCCNKSDMPMKK